MAPKRVQIARADARRPAPKGYVSNDYNTLTSPENASVVRSVAVFGVSLSYSPQLQVATQWRCFGPAVVIDGQLDLR